MKSTTVAQLDADIESIERNVDGVLAEDLYWFPVRHHSVVVARQLQAAIKAVRPRILFIEGPADAAEMIPFIVDGKTRPPIAMYSSYCDDDNTLGLAGIASPAEDIPPRFSSWYPLLEYSPEFVAMKAAHKVGIDIVFMDLPHYGLLKSRDTTTTDEKPAADLSADPPAGQLEHEAERLIVESGFYRKLAKEAGYRSWDEAWDSMFEIRDWPDHEVFRKEMATFCAAVRATTVPERIAHDGTLPRERFMLRTIRETLRLRKLKPSDAMVVCGGFHLFLDRDDPELPPELPAGTVYNTVVPYSFFRVSELSGYGAGNRAPQFYQTAWEMTQRKEADGLLVEQITAVLRRARRHGENLSSADAIAVTQHARMLASLRGRATPVLDDIQDALITCCCKGNPADEGVHLLRAIDEVNIGTKVGWVTPALGRLPIVNDFFRQLDELELTEVMGREKRQTLDLDKRTPLDERRSAFLHRLAFLKIPLVQLAEAAETEFAAGMIFRERWELRWSPQVESALVEQNLFGTSIESAVLAKLVESLASDVGHAGTTCGHLRRAIEMDLPALIAEVEQACADSIDTDPRFVSLCDALSHLIVIKQQAIYRGLGTALIEALTARCFDRACFSLLDVASAPEDQQNAVVNAMLSLADVLLKRVDGRFDRELFGTNVRSAAEESTVPFLRGAFLGMLAEIRHLTPNELAAEISAFAHAPVEIMSTAGDFLDGVLAVSRTSIMLGADALVGAIDELLRNATWDVFLTMIPKMRGAFERLHARQCDSLAGRVAVLYGLCDDGESLTELDTSIEAAAMIVQIDQQVAKIMEDWRFES